MIITCSHCGIKFNSSWSDEEANAEFNKTFDGFDITDSDVVCEDCYKKIMNLLRIKLKYI